MTEPFGHHAPSPKQQAVINTCRQMSPSWWNKQRAQWLRKKIMKQLDHPLDLELDGIRLRCYLSDNISERSFVFMPWRFDHLERRYLTQYLPASGVFIDVGANVGIYSCLALTQLNHQGHILAIEPNPKVSHRLSFNLQATSETQPTPARFQIIKQGVNDQASSCTLYIDNNNLGASSLKNKSEQTITIDCQPLLTLLYQAKINQIDVMKVDIEGAEDLALVPFLSQANDALLPNCLIFENNPEQWQLPLLETLEAKHYQLAEKTRMNRVYLRHQCTIRKVKFTKPKLITGNKIPSATKSME